MLADQWDAQETIKRISVELKRRGYVVWLDIEQMAGSIMDAMSAAVEGADVMLLGVSRLYKESANCRLEANYGMQEKRDMVPLKMEEVRPYNSPPIVL